MRKIPHTYRTSSGVYYFRIAVPTRYKWKQKEIRFSLGTKSYQEAKVQAFKLWSSFQRINGLSDIDEFLNKQNSTLIIKSEKKAIELISIDKLISLQDYKTLRHALQKIYDDNGEFYCSIPPIEAMLYSVTYEKKPTGGVVERVTLDEDRSGKVDLQGGYIQIAKEDIHAYLESRNDSLKISHFKLLDAENDCFSPTSSLSLSPFSLFIEKDKADSLNIKPTYRQNNSNSNGLKLSDALNDYITNSSHLKERTIKQYEESINLFIEIIGNKYIEEISYNPDIRKFVKYLDLIPKNRNKNKEFKNLTLEQIIKKQKNDKSHEVISLTTKKKHAERISSFFQYYIDKQVISGNPVRKLYRTKKINTLEEKTPFTDQDINKLFNSDLAVSMFNKQKYKFAKLWGYLLLLYTGARPEEIYQLTIDDIDLSTDIKTISFAESATKSLKNNSAKRVIPIHPHLLEVGFIDFVENVKKVPEVSDSSRLFFYLNKSNGHGYSRNPADWFNNSLAVKLCIKTDKKSLYSFRHSVIDKLKSDPKVQTLFRTTYVGHQRGETESENRYGNDINPEQLNTILDAIDFGLDLKIIKSKIGRAHV